MEFPWTAKWMRVGRFLKGFRTSREEDLDDVGHRLEEILRAHEGGDEGRQLRQLIPKKGSMRRVLTSLENDSSGVELTRLRNYPKTPVDLDITD
jgi:hypothetical protein